MNADPSIVNVLWGAYGILFIALCTFCILLNFVYDDYKQGLVKTNPAIVISTMFTGIILFLGWSLYTVGGMITELIV